MASDMNGTDVKNAKDQRAYFSGRFAVELDLMKKQLGTVVSVDGGHFKSEAIGEQVGGEGKETRYPGRQKFDDITITIGTLTMPGWWSWFKQSIGNKYKRTNGAIITYDFDGKERERRTIKDALLAEIAFPTLDAKAKSPATISIKLAPEQMEWAETKGSNGDVARGGVINKQKLWVPANFRLGIDGFDKEVMRWVQKVDGFTIKQNIILNPIGDEKYVRKEIGRIEWPALTFYIAEHKAKPFLDWWKSFVGQMEHTSNNEKTGFIEYLASDCSTVVGRIDFGGIGITGCTFEKHDAGTDAMRFLKVECYTESMEVKPGTGTE